MRVVQYGRIKPRRVRCDHCLSIIEYTNHDICYVLWDKPTIHCPVCSHNLVNAVWIEKELTSNE